MKRNASVVTIATILVALVAWQHAPTNGTGVAGAATTKPTSPASVVPSASSGYVVHFDQNGNVVAEVTPEDQAQFNAALEKEISTSSQGLVEKSSPVAGGGVMMNLDGRFQSAATATRDAHGNLAVPCLTNEADVRAFNKATADAASKKE